MKTLLIYSRTQGIHEMYYDDEDEQLISQHTWHINKRSDRQTPYARTNIFNGEKYKAVLLHRLLLDLTDLHILVDHKDGNGLNNQRGNLRLSNNTQNAQNARVQSVFSSDYKVVSFRDNVNKPWRSRIMVNGKNIHLGVYSNQEVAARAYDTAARGYFGEFALLNFP